MGFYNDRIVPHLVRMSMRQPTLVPYRERVASAAEGRVLELSIGAEETGFRIEHIETGYIAGPKPMTFMYEGRARRT